MRGKALTVLACVAVAATAAAVWALRGGGSRPSSAPAISTTTAPVTRTDVAQRQEVNGTLSYAGSYTALAARGGTVTRLPAIGTTVTRGRAAFEVNGVPVPLLYGARPLWRELRPGVPDGADVRELEGNLTALGYGSGLTVDRHFSAATCWAVRRWQAAAGLPVTGTVPLGQVTVLAGPLRVTGRDAKIGAQVHPGAPVVHGTSSVPVVDVRLDPTMAPQVRAGDRVLVTMPSGDVERGVVSRVSRVAVTQPGGGDQPAQPLIPATVRLPHAASGPDQAQVQVAVATEEHRGVLAVPVTALLARPDGGHQVVIVSGSVRRAVAVEVGLFDETAGVVEVHGFGLAAGERVEVPAQ